ncbi:MAG: cupin, partial [Albidovulum sp.]|nr:cupin [Albidovulum sp.]
DSFRYCIGEYEVLMPTEGYWRISWEAKSDVLAPGDTCLVPPGLERCIQPAVSGPAGLFRVKGTTDPAGPTWRP